jgi:NAD+ diphosphatase
VNVTTGHSTTRDSTTGHSTTGSDAVTDVNAAEAQRVAAELGGFVLARSGVDRAGERRDDAEWLAAVWADPRTRVLLLDDGQALVWFGAQRAELVLVPPADAPEGVRFLLGADPEGVVYFGVAGPVGGLGADSAAAPGRGSGSGPPAEPGVRPAGLRQAAVLLDDRDAGLLTHAVALANWHATHTHCPRCGSLTEVVSAGHARHCPVDGSEHFPRIDPAVIMLVTDPDDRCLLARNRQWPPRRVSILAGFVEPGEAAEQAVAREVAEETGITVGQIRYLGSQPWPMPQSLMLGFRALASGAQDIQVDADEIVEARWFSRAELRASVAAGELLLPPPVSIAHRIIESWYGEELPGSW